MSINPTHRAEITGGVGVGVEGGEGSSERIYVITNHIPCSPYYSEGIHTLVLP